LADAGPAAEMMHQPDTKRPYPVNVIEKKKGVEKGGRTVLLEKEIIFKKQIKGYRAES